MGTCNSWHTSPDHGSRALASDLFDQTTSESKSSTGQVPLKDTGIGAPPHQLTNCDSLTVSMFLDCITTVSYCWLTQAISIKLTIVQHYVTYIALNWEVFG